MIKGDGIYEFQTNKEAIVNVTNYDEGRIHVAWKTGDGRIISFEAICGNWPDVSYCIWDSEKEYREAIEDIDWIQEGISENDNDE